MRKPYRELAPSTWALAALVVAAVAFRAVYFWLAARHLPVVGDERFYFSTAQDLITVLGSFGRGSSSAVAEALDRIVGNGWFMPGMTFVLLPLRLFTDDIGAVRLWVGCLNLLLFVLLVLRIDRVFSRPAGLAFAALAGGLPVYVAYSFLFWGELIAIQVALLLFIHLRAFDEGMGERGHSSLRAAAYAVPLLFVVYVRPSLILLLPLLLGIVLAQYLAAFSPRRGIRLYLGFALPLLAVFGLGIAPWSALLSSHMGGFFLTTTSLHLNKITAFTPRGSFEELTGRGLSAHSVDAHIRDVMSATGLEYKPALQSVAAELLSGVGFSDYRDAVRRNTKRYFCPQGEFADRSARLLERGKPARAAGRGVRASLQRWMRRLDRALWYPLLALVLVAVLVPLVVRASWSFPLALKGLFWALAVQPFVSAVHWRHYVALVPVILVTVAIGCGQGGPRLLRPGACQTLGHRLACGGHVLSAGLAVVAVWLLLG